MNRLKKFWLFLVVVLIAAGFSVKNSEVNTVFLRENRVSWADSIYATLTPDERIGQLFMVAAYSNKDKKHEDEVLTLIEKNKI